jgi:hypothetical protein
MAGRSLTDDELVEQHGEHRPVVFGAVALVLLLGVGSVAEHVVGFFLDLVGEGLTAFGGGELGGLLGRQQHDDAVLQLGHVELEESPTLASDTRSTIVDCRKCSPSSGRG